MPVTPVLFYHGKKPYKWSLSFQEGVWGRLFAKIPVSLRKDMLNYRLRVLDTHAPAVKRALKDHRLKTRGALSLLSNIWFLKPSVSELTKALTLFAGTEQVSEQKKDAILNAVEYLDSALSISKKTWIQVENNLIQKDLLKKGGVMNIREVIREKAKWEGWQEGRQEGRQEERQEVIFNMLKERADIAFIAKVTGLSEKEIKRLQKRKKR